MFLSLFFFQFIIIFSKIDKGIIIIKKSIYIVSYKYYEFKG